jgi:hypothetical protein
MNLVSLRKLFAFYLILIFTVCVALLTARLLTVVAEEPIPISTCQELQDINLNLGADYILTQDINCAETATWNEDPENLGTYLGFEPIGTYDGCYQGEGFSGSLDGRGYKITDLYINRNTIVGCVGLFSEINSASINNLGLENAQIIAGSDAWAVGGFAGVAMDSAITNVYFSGTVSGSVWGLGGIVGAGENIHITDSYTEGNFSGSNNIAGLAGAIYYGSIINNSYSTGDVNCVDYCGGLVGEVGFSDDANNQIIDSYATGDVVAVGLIAGGLVGDNYATISGSYATGSVTASEYVGGLVGRLHNNAVIEGSFANGNVSGNDQVGGLVGRTFNNVQITLSHATGNISGTGTIAGGLVGMMDSGVIDSSYATGTVDGTGILTGGLVAWTVESVTITDSYATGIVTGGGEYTGGLVGYYNLGTISNSFATGDVHGADTVGGLAGVSVGTISTSYATGNIFGVGDVAGGLVGASGGSIENSYATGNVSGAGIAVGGLVGTLNAGTIESSYSTGSVENTDTLTGGLVGQKSFNEGVSITSSFWDTTTSGMLVGCGGGDCTGTFFGKTTAQMMDINTFTTELGEDTWNFETIWNIDPKKSINTGYPFLRAFGLEPEPDPEPPSQQSAPSSSSRVQRTSLPTAADNQFHISLLQAGISSINELPKEEKESAIMKIQVQIIGILRNLIQSLAR